MKHRIVVFAIVVVIIMVAAPVKNTSPSMAFAQDDSAVGEIRIDASGIEQVWVPPGCFVIGDSEEQIALWVALYGESYRENLEQSTPQTEVCFEEGFWLDRYEVTNAAFAVFVDDGGYENADYWTEEGWAWKNEAEATQPFCWDNEQYPGFDAPDQPVVCINWFEAYAYAQWRGGRLPSEAEWEYAARGPEGYLYVWGDTYDPGMLNFCDVNCGEAYAIPGADDTADDGFATTAPVGSYEHNVSWVGAYDMTGNAEEWTNTLATKIGDFAWVPVLEDYPYDANDGREDSYASGDRIIRGGSWSSMAITSRTTFRANSDPSVRFNTYGVRILTD